MGLPVIAPWDAPCKAWKSKGYEVLTFDVPHDNVPCFGFLINRKILYATDCEYIRYNFKKWELETIIVECNYQEKYVDLESKNFAHIYLGHMGLKTCTDFLMANQTDKLKTVILCHLSRGNANPVECLDAVQTALGNTVNVHIAEKGLELEI